MFLEVEAKFSDLWAKVKTTQRWIVKKIGDSYLYMYDMLYMICLFVYVVIVLVYLHYDL